MRLTYQAANPRQRAELLRRVAMGERQVIVLKLLRAFAAAPQPIVRAAAEEGLKSMFGATYGKKMDIPPPVQPPRSED